MRGEREPVAGHLCDVCEKRAKRFDDEPSCGRGYRAEMHDDFEVKEVFGKRYAEPVGVKSCSAFVDELTQVASLRPTLVRTGRMKFMHKLVKM